MTHEIVRLRVLWAVLDGPHRAGCDHVELRMALRRARRWTRTWWPVVTLVVIAVITQIAKLRGWLPPEWP